MLLCESIHELSHTATLVLIVLGIMAIHVLKLVPIHGLLTKNTFHVKISHSKPKPYTEFICISYQSILYTSV